MFVNRLKFLLVVSAILLLQPISGHAKEGLWLPAQLKKIDSILRVKGLKVPVSTLYNSKGNGLNNAVVLFGRGCTASFISNDGLLITNHHCGYGYAQRLSTREHNFLKNGFWAMNKKQEIPCPGLTITITKKMTNVTDYVLANVPDTLIGAKREKAIQVAEKAIAKAYAEITGLNTRVKSFYDGNEYWVMMTKQYKDVRLVAFPPNSIGKFGGDKDNWMWPRMTGDFSLFRVYADKNNQPADFSPNNLPLHPKKHLTIATSGYHDSSFAMVYGFPYRTEEYLTSYQLGRILHIEYPIRIKIRGLKLAVWNSAMDADPGVFLKYAAKQASISNGYKKWMGVLESMGKSNAMEKRESYQQRVMNWAQTQNNNANVSLLLPRIQAAVEGNKNALKAREFIREAVMGVELIRETLVLQKIINLYRKHPGDTTAILTGMHKLERQLHHFYKNYNRDMDKKVFEAVMPVYMNQNDKVAAPGLRSLLRQANNNYKTWSGSIFYVSLFAHPAQLINMLNEIQPRDTLRIYKDPAYLVYHAVTKFSKTKVRPAMKNYRKTMMPLRRHYMKWLRQFPHPNHVLYPDANQTLRLSFGKVRPLKMTGFDKFQTTLGDLRNREDTNQADFTIPRRLKNLYQNKDYGQWTQNGKLPVNFITTCQTSGGNSGSPVLNAKGQLIGLNFDRPWQGTMSDFYFSDNYCRNISVDIRYVLFLIQKYGHAGWLLEEMDIVN